MQTKTCRKCNVVQPISEFYADPKRPCKSCRHMEAKLRYATNKKYYDEYRKINRDKIRETQQKYYENHKDIIAQYWNNWKNINSDKIIASRARFLIRHPDYEKNKATKARKELSKKYVRNLISRNLKNIEVPDVLVEVKRLEILIKRRIKHENSNTTT